MRIEMCVCCCLSVCLATAFAGIHEEPDGVSVRVDDAGNYQIVSVGSGVYDLNDADDILGARQEAERNAKVGIAKFLKESLSSEESASTMTDKVKSFKSEGGQEVASVSKKTAKEIMSKIKNSASALLTGVVVLEDERMPNGEAGGIYRVMVGVSSKTTAAAMDVGATRGNQGKEQQPHVGGTTPESGTAEASTVNASEQALPSAPEGWLVCVGVAAGRNASVKAALLEGISQVYGEHLQRDERFAERIAKLKVKGGGELCGDIDLTLASKAKESVSETLTKTAGFVREYRIIQVVPKGDCQEATVHARIVDPRAGGTKALMVKKPTMSISDRSTIYQLGPKTRMSGADIIKAVQFAIPNGLANANKFIVLTDSSLGKVIESNVSTTAMVGAGLASASELAQCGQGLTADYTLETEIMDVKYSSKLAQDKKTKKFGKMSKLSVKMNVTLADARSGSQVKSDIITITLDNDEINGLLEDDEDADLLQAVLGKLAAPIEEWMKK